MEAANPDPTEGCPTPQPSQWLSTSLECRPRAAIFCSRREGSPCHPVPPVGHTPANKPVFTLPRIPLRCFCTRPRNMGLSQTFAVVYIIWYSTKRCLQGRSTRTWTVAGWKIPRTTQICPVIPTQTACIKTPKELFGATRSPVGISHDDIL